MEVRTIWALEISNKPGEDDPSKPKIRFVAGIHGNAAVGTELLLEFAALLCINYGKNPYVTTVSSVSLLVILFYFFHFLSSMVSVFLNTLSINFAPFF